MPKIFVTISPPQRKGRIPHLYLDDIVCIVCAMKGIRRWIIYPELDKKDRLHYHGIINLTDHEYVTFYRKCRPMLEKIGYIQTSRIENFAENLRTVIYCRKQWGEMKDLLQITSPIMAQRPKDTMKMIQSQMDNLDYGIKQNTFIHYGFIEG